jgi:hypothetical protein
MREDGTSSAVAGLPKPSRSKSSIAATRALTSGTGASTRERSPQPEHSTVSQTGLTADPAASSSDAVSCCTFAVAAAARDGLTVAGSAFVGVVSTVVSTSAVGAETMRNTGLAAARFFGVRPCRSISASTVASSSA